jgi:pilus assembly protein CpaC
MRLKPLLLLFPLLCCCSMAWGQAGPAKEITLTVGRGELLQLEGEVKTVAASEPKIADVVVVSPREVMVNAKGIGKATVIIWEDRALPKRYEVNVISDQQQYDAVRRAVQQAVGDNAISVQGNLETMVLSGNVKTIEESKRAEAIASTYSKKVVNLLTVPPPADPRQILLEVKFATVDRSALQEIGFNFFSRNSKTLGLGSTQQFATPRFSQLQFQDQEFANSTLNFSDLLNLFVFRPDLNIGATIRAMQARNLLQVLAEPNLIALEGKEASFLAGGEFPFPTLTATSTGGATAPVVTVQFKKFGVQLDFTPTVTASGGIHLKVRPQVSSLDYANAVTLQGFLIPAVATRVAETEAILKDGESFAVAGLIDSRVIQSLSRVKWLGDVPILGQLFRSRSVRKTNDELLVVVTPRFVRPVPAGEKVALPDTVEQFLPAVKDDKDAGLKKPKAKKQKKSSPEFIGPSGHQEPKK